MMTHYARAENGKVVETFDTDGDITTMFHPDFVWVEAPEDVEQGWTYSEGQFAAPVTPPIEIVIPAIVTSAQGGIALIQAGQMDAVQAVADAADTPAEIKWAWRHAQNWERDSPALAFLSQKAGLTDKQMDDLFIAAAQIQA